MADTNCFEGMTPENVDNCANDLAASGLGLRVQYTPATFIENMTLPAKTGTLDATLRIAAGDLMLKADAPGWKGIDLKMNENELKEMLVGGIANQKGQVELSFYIPKFSVKALAWKRRFANVPLVFNVPDSEGNNWIVGTKFSPAMIESAESTTGKGYEDPSGTTCTIKANTYVYLYEGDITETSDAAAGTP